MSLEVVVDVFQFWNHNRLISPNHCIWEIGMGIPKFALALAGYFKRVVASDTDFDIYSNIVHYFETLSVTSTFEKFEAAQVIMAVHSNGRYEKKNASYLAVTNVRTTRKKAPDVHAQVTDDEDYNSDEQDVDDNSDESSYIGESLSDEDSDNSEESYDQD